MTTTAQTASAARLADIRRLAEAALAGPADTTARQLAEGVQWMLTAAAADQQRVRSLVTDMAGETGSLGSQVAYLTADLEQARAELAAERERTSRLEDALAEAEQRAASMRIALDDADADAEGTR
ncbi:hypothetical protein [Micromonospora okii]|uniref:hypothetical protein n=1 Tax=Micromonospora okii TaxID=1182970 RepID=UPI001E4B5BAF|nr:hypothetical protein [Micromonospora okii]